MTLRSTNLLYITDAAIPNTGVEIDAYEVSGSSPPNTNEDLGHALSRAKESAGALAMVLVTCASEGHSPLECPVARSLQSGAAQDLAWLQELTLAEQFDSDRATDDGFPSTPPEAAVAP